LNTKENFIHQPDQGHLEIICEVLNKPGVRNVILEFYRT